MTLLAGCATGQEATSPPDTGEVIGEVSWIDDGDTIDVESARGTITVRLLAINAPDRGECFANQARNHLIDTLEGTTVRLEILGVDQFDRTLAHVFEGDRHVNLEMVAMGLALASTLDATDAHGQAILAAEEEAFSIDAGLWSSHACGAPDDLPALSIDTASSDPDPPGPDDENLGSEIVVVNNEGDRAVDLSGWTLRDESSRHRFSFPAGLSISPGDTISVPSDSTGWDPGGSAVWNNEGDMALLLDPTGTVVDRWRY